MLPVTTGYLSFATLKEALEAAEWDMRDLRMAILENPEEVLACSESQFSRFRHGLYPGKAYRAAMNRALATKGVQVEWPN